MWLLDTDRSHGEGLEDGWILHDGGMVMAGAGAARDVAVPLKITFFTDNFGPPPARWPVESLPLAFCTYQNNRPSTITAEEFRDAVANAARVWNETGTAAGVRYAGDCVAGFRQVLENDRSEIGFDDSRNLVQGAQAAATLGLWREFSSLLDREFVETDIVLDQQPSESLPLQCFRTTIVHEMGHALGLGHSDDRGDLMFPSFNPNDLRTCQTGPSAAEISRLQELYGVDRPPAVDAGDGGTVEPNAAMTLTATGSDPEGMALTFEWKQVSGPAVVLRSGAATTTFTAPATIGVTLVFEVTAFDRFLHPAVATTSVTVRTANEPPGAAPGLLSFSRGEGSDAELTWDEVSGASSYQFCSQLPGQRRSIRCQDLATPSAGIDWDSALSTRGVASDTRVLIGGVRETSVRACNSQGCSGPGLGPLAGGLQWAAWEVDYDFFVMAFDFGRLQFTIVGVVNVEGPDRSFTFYNGSAADPKQKRVRACGAVTAGTACVGLLRPGDQHFGVATVVSERSGVPTVEHRVTIR
ncbi:MAG: matrixin family metalloprotease [Dehalococcoidia bacterium]|nr:matrixin family metalloprotease [Dehalococcoidia bacterium]